ncbi:hypothetical protein MUNTM_42350, partial [Mycobacterium sp. MUNTM1]
RHASVTPAAERHASVTLEGAGPAALPGETAPGGGPPLPHNAAGEPR